MDYTTFAVVGRGPFPFDMLRYDEAWPRDTESAQALATVGMTEDRFVTLTTVARHRPTPERWASFGWRVLAVGDGFEVADAVAAERREIERVREQLKAEQAEAERRLAEQQAEEQRQREAAYNALPLFWGFKIERMPYPTIGRTDYRLYRDGVRTTYFEVRLWVHGGASVTQTYPRKERWGGVRSFTRRVTHDQNRTIMTTLKAAFDQGVVEGPLKAEEKTDA
ncbi:MAG TPA: hypothetical protein VD864_14730, partial [Nocardioides sp.]|nr:hypothetical protein [Nocardioides sp.]